MKKLILLFFTLFTLNAYSQYDDLYYDGSYDGYHTTTYLTYNHFPNYSARINFFYGSGIYFTWSLFNYYWYTPYYSWNYYSWYRPNYYNWQNNYYTYNHHHYYRRFKNRNTYYGHRNRMTNSTPTRKPIKPAQTKVVKKITKVTTPIKTYTQPKTVHQSHIVYNKPTRNTTTKVVRTYNKRPPTNTPIKSYNRPTYNNNKVKNYTRGVNPTRSTYSSRPPSRPTPPRKNPR